MTMFIDRLFHNTVVSHVIFMAMISVPALYAYSEPTQVGVYYFGGWQSGPNFHLDKPLSNLLSKEYESRKPILGWYDDDQKVMDQEIISAMKGGVDYFAFLWYWPDTLAKGETRLNYPIKLFLESKSKERKNFKFCIVYTNHGKLDIDPGNNWIRYTRLWVKWMSRRDYFRVATKREEQAKPLFIIFSPQRFHDHWKTVPGGAKGALIGLREMAIKKGLPGIVIGGCWEGVSKEVIEGDGYDIVTGYNFAWLISEFKKIQTKVAGSYDSLAQEHISIWDSMAVQGKPIIPLITSGWDPRPWPETAMISPYYPDRNPQKFYNFCRSAKTWIDAHEMNVVVPKTILIYAWNELGEGGYILPTEGEGFSYLEAVNKAFAKDIPSVKR